MNFEWDERKNIANIKKHGISFEEAAFVFADKDAISLLDKKHNQEEDRWITMGQVIKYGVVIVVHTDRIKGTTDFIRIISARKAVRTEKNEYYNRSRSK